MSFRKRNVALGASNVKAASWSFRSLIEPGPGCPSISARWPAHHVYRHANPRRSVRRARWLSTGSLIAHRRKWDYRFCWGSSPLLCCTRHCPWTPNPCSWSGRALGSCAARSGECGYCRPSGRKGDKIGTRENENRMAIRKGSGKLVQERQALQGGSVERATR